MSDDAFAFDIRTSPVFPFVIRHSHFELSQLRHSTYSTFDIPTSTFDIPSLMMFPLSTFDPRHSKSDDVATFEIRNLKLEIRNFPPSTFALRHSHFSSFLLYFFLLLTAKADFTIKQRMENAGSIQEITLEIKDSKCRVDASQQSTAIIDSKTGETTVLIHPSKTYMKLAPEQLRAQGDAVKNLLKDQANPPPDAALAPTGKKETINGFETEEYTATLNGVVIMFAIAKDFPNYQKFVLAMYNMQIGPGMESFRSLSLPPDQYPGMPIRTAVEIMGQKVITSLETAVEGPVADSEFSIPGDYKELTPNTK